MINAEDKSSLVYLIKKIVPGRILISIAYFEEPRIITNKEDPTIVELDGIVKRIEVAVANEKNMEKVSKDLSNFFRACGGEEYSLSVRHFTNCFPPGYYKCLIYTNSFLIQLRTFMNFARAICPGSIQKSI